MHSLSTDPSRKLISASLDGFLSVADVASFFEGEQAAAKAMGCHSGEHLLLVDLRNFLPQTQDVVAGFEHMIVNRPIQGKRIAIIVGSALTRLQVKRMTDGHDNVAFFDAFDEASAWLIQESGR